MERNEEVAALLASGIEPLTVTRTVVRDCSTGLPRAFRTALQINSLELGTLTDAEYTLTAERTGRSLLLFERALLYVGRAIGLCLSSGLDFDWISVRCPLSALTRAQVYDTVLRVFAGNETVLSRLCIECPAELLSLPRSDKVPETLAALRGAGIRTMLRDFGEEFCPTMRLSAYDFDYVCLHKDVMELMRRSDTARSATALLRFVKGFSTQLVVPDLDRTELSRYRELGCYGYTDRSSGRLFDEEGAWQKVTA